MHETSPHDQDRADKAKTLAQNLFGFSLVAWILLLITGIMLLLSPTPATAGYQQIRTIILIGFGLLILIWLVFVIWIYRQPVDKLTKRVAPLARIFGNKWFAVIIVLLIIWINLALAPLLFNVAPSITDPLRFLVFTWSLLFIGLLFVLHRSGLNNWLTRTRKLWIAVGLVITLSVGIVALSWVTNKIIDASGVGASLRSNLDYRQYSFYDDGGQPPDPAQYQRELGQLRVQWLPYTYWTVEPVTGDYINVSENGTRHTPSFVDENANAENIFFFGGSTLWGEGARDAYTIPSHIARLLAESDMPQNVRNYGQTGYVSTQDMNMFQLQLANNNIPDIAVFYQGFNDTYSAYLQGHAGLPLREENRISDVEAGRILRAGQPLLQLPPANIEDYDWSLVATDAATAEEIADRWLANVRMVNAIAEEYGIHILFVWQPMIQEKHLTDEESRITRQLEEQNPGFSVLYQQVDELIRENIAQGNLENVIILSDLFSEIDDDLFLDLVHITEQGNLFVAEAILPEIVNLLSN